MLSHSGQAINQAIESILILPGSEDQKRKNAELDAEIDFKISIQKTISFIIQEAQKADARDRVLIMQAKLEHSEAEKKRFEENIQYQQQVAIKQQLLKQSTDLSNLIPVYIVNTDPKLAAANMVIEAAKELEQATQEVTSFATKVDKILENSFSKAIKKAEAAKEAAIARGALVEELAELEKDINDLKAIQAASNSAPTFEKIVRITEGMVGATPVVLNKLMYGFKGSKKGPVNFLAQAKKKERAGNLYAEDVDMNGIIHGIEESKQALDNENRKKANFYAAVDHFYKLNAEQSDKEELHAEQTEETLPNETNEKTLDAIINFYASVDRFLTAYHLHTQAEINELDETEAEWDEQSKTPAPEFSQTRLRSGSNLFNAKPDNAKPDTSVNDEIFSPKSKTNGSGK